MNQKIVNNRVCDVRNYVCAISERHYLIKYYFVIYWGTNSIDDFIPLLYMGDQSFILIVYFISGFTQGSVFAPTLVK